MGNFFDSPEFNCASGIFLGGIPTVSEIKDCIKTAEEIGDYLQTSTSQYQNSSFCQKTDPGTQWLRWSNPLWHPFDLYKNVASWLSGTPLGSPVILGTFALPPCSPDPAPNIPDVLQKLGKEIVSRPASVIFSGALLAGTAAQARALPHPGSAPQEKPLEPYPHPLLIFGGPISWLADKLSQ